MSRAQAVCSTGSTKISALLSFSMLSTSWGEEGEEFASTSQTTTKIGEKKTAQILLLCTSERCSTFSNPASCQTTPPLDKGMNLGCLRLD